MFRFRLDPRALLEIQIAVTCEDNGALAEVPDFGRTLELARRR